MLIFSRWKIFFILCLLFFGFLFALPNIVPVQAYLPSFLYSILPLKTINLGLDLKGGSYVLLGVDKAGLAKERMEPFWEEAKRELRRLGISYKSEAPVFDSKNSQASFAFTLSNSEDYNKAYKSVQRLVSTESALLSLVKKGKDSFAVVIAPFALTQEAQQASLQSLEILRRRIDALGTTEPVIQLYGKDRILVEVPGLADPKELVMLLGRMAKLNFHLLDDKQITQKVLESHVPEDDEVLYLTVEDKRIPVLIKRRVALDGSLLVDARAGFDQDNKPNISFRFNATGARIFANITRHNVGKPFAIVLDKEVLSTPVITEPILGGSGQITGHFSVEEANRLAILLRAGALPAPLKVLSEHTVGANLGADAIRHGLMASLAGLVIVMLFMGATYGLFGLFADIALLANLMLIIATLSMLQATLTLPGIAGIVLTLGMAVDANVLIFERIREENDAKRSPLSCIEAGYNKALATILDSNITTLLAAFILFVLGSGPIRGFAVTLIIGIFTSLFTAYTLNRLIVATWFYMKRPKVLIL